METSTQLIIAPNSDNLVNEPFQQSENRIFVPCQQFSPRINCQLSFLFTQGIYDSHKDKLCIKSKKELSQKQILDELDNMKIGVTIDGQFLVTICNLKQLLIAQKTYIFQFKNQIGKTEDKNYNFVYKIGLQYIMPVSCPKNSMMVNIEKNCSENIIDIYFDCQSFNAIKHNNHRLEQLQFINVDRLNFYSKLLKENLGQYKIQLRSKSGKEYQFRLNNTVILTNQEYQSTEEAVTINLYIEQADSFYLYYYYQI